MGFFNFRKGNKIQEKRSNEVVENSTQNCSQQHYSSYLDELALLFENSFSTKSMAISAVFAAIEIISNALAVLPIRIKRTTPNGKEEVLDHPFLRALKNMPLSKYNMVKKMIVDMLVEGNGYAYIERTNDGSVKRIIYCEPGDVQIFWDKYQQELYYTCSVVSNNRIEPINMIHLYKNTNDGFEGVGILSYAKEIINLAGATNSSAYRFFTSGCNVNGVLTYTGSLSDKQKAEIRNNWQQTHSGNQASGVAVLPGGMKYEQTGSSANDSQLLESRTFNITEIARFFNINPVLLGDLSKSSYNTLEAAQLEFVVHTLLPYITLIETELNRKILKPSEFNLSIDLDENYLLRADKSSTASFYNTFLNDGVFSINEVRHQLGYGDIEGGDNHIIAYTKLESNTIENLDNENQNDLDNEDEEGN